MPDSVVNGQPAGPDEPETVSPLARRQRRLLTIAVAAALLSTIGLFASLVIKSPQQIAAEAQPPAGSVLTAPVERRVLIDTVLLRGKVEPQITIEVTPAPRDGVRAVVTALRTNPGSVAASGQVLLEVSGRPLFVLPGAVPAYRDLRPGAEGKDIAQLQAALRTLGHRVSDRQGLFGETTKTAVAAFYGSLGYPVPTTGDGDARAIQDGQRRITQMERALADAQRELAAAQADASGSPPPPGSQTRVEAALIAVERAQQDLTSARDDLASLRRTTGAMVPLAEMVFLPSLPARVEKVSASMGALVTQPLITLSSGAPSIKAHLSPAQRELVRPGMEVRVNADLLAITAQATIATIGELATDEIAGRGYPMVAIPTSPLDQKLIGQDVRLTVERARTSGEVLVVPLAAITTTAGGQAIVVKRTPGGHEERITVTPATSGDGYVAVTPISGQLNPGDRVVIGR